MQRLDYLKKLHHLVTSSETDEDPLYAAVDKVCALAMAVSMN